MIVSETVAVKNWLIFLPDEKAFFSSQGCLLVTQHDWDDAHQGAEMSNCLFSEPAHFQIQAYDSAHKSSTWRIKRDAARPKVRGWQFGWDEEFLTQRWRLKQPWSSAEVEKYVDLWTAAQVEKYVSMWACAEQERSVDMWKRSKPEV